MKTRNIYRPYIIPIFLPNAGCKRRCVFCSQKDVTGVERVPTLIEVRNEIKKFLNYFKDKTRSVEIAFYGGTFTALPIEIQRKYIETALEFVDKKRVIGLRISTRPDDIPPEELDFLKKNKVITIELGIQSFCDDVLKESNRGYDSKQAISGCKRVKSKGFNLGIHLMTGLPSSSHTCDLYSAFKTVEMNPDMVRIHPTLVIKNSMLEEMYLNNSYTPQSLEESLDILSDMYLIFSRYSIPINRMGLQIPVELRNSIVAGPYHPSLGDLVEYESFYKLGTWFFKKFKSGEIVIGKNNLFLLNGYSKKNLRRFGEYVSRIKVIENVENIFFKIGNNVTDYPMVLEKYIEELRSKLETEGRE